MTFRKKHTFFLLLCFFISCGRKRNDFLSFSSTGKAKKTNVLALPVVREIYVHNVAKGNQIFWEPVQQSEYVCLGYSIYCFESSAFIPKKPMCVVPQNVFTCNDFNKGIYKKTCCYLVRGRFVVDGKILEGPASKIVHVKKPSNLEQAGGLGGRTIL